MKPKQKKPETIYRIIDKKTGNPVGSYSRAYCDEYDFESVEDARSANCHNTFQDRKKYKIAKYKVTYELIEDDVDKNIKDEESQIEKMNRTVEELASADLDTLILQYLIKFAEENAIEEFKKKIEPQ
jgi:hypothetical protein